MKARRILFIICCLTLLFGCGHKETDPAPPVGSKTYSLTITVSGEGTVDEKLVSTRADYSSGSIVELTANPSAGWRFSRWEGDLQGEANPAEIEVTSPKTVNALFEKENYSFNVRIVGPGAVDEFLSEDTKTTLSYGTKVRLAAFPSEGAVFKGWSGGIESGEPEIEYPVSSSEEIIATFSYDKSASKYDLPDLYTSSIYRKNLYYGLDFTSFTSTPSFFLPVDYDRDGYIDVISCSSDFSASNRFPIRFHKGNSDGTYDLDEVNDSKFEGLINGPRKMFYGDFNGDGNVDIAIVGHGYDGAPWPGESPIILFGSSSGEYTMQYLTEVHGYYHGSCAGDFDNDGDLDIFLLDHGIFGLDNTPSYMLVNDGNGAFTIRSDLINKSEIGYNMYTAEMFDFNHDGFLDLFVGGHENEGGFPERYKNTTCVFWGNGETFNHDNVTRMPRFKDGYGVTLDYCFYDLDGDGIEEFINVRTGDGLAVPSYCGWSIQIVGLENGEYADITDRYINDSDNSETEGPAVVWIDFEEIDGKVYLCGRKEADAIRLFCLEDSKLVKVQETSAVQKPENGLHIYSDGAASVGEVDYGCNENPHWGRTCIKVSNWKMWTQLTIPLNKNKTNGTDLSYLKDNDYVLEFFIKNTNPAIEIHFKFNSVIYEDHSEDATFCYVYKGSEHQTDGTWERITVPLKTMDEWNKTEDFWKKIDNFNMIICSDGGQDFYLDEIRIRKIL